MGSTESSVCPSPTTSLCYTTSPRQQYSADQPMPMSVRQMHMAVMQNDLTALKDILRNGVDVNYPWFNPDNPSAKDGCTAIAEAIALNHVAVAKALIEAGVLIEHVDRIGISPLLRAAYHGRHQITELLLIASADVTRANKEGNTALQMCAKNGFVHNNAKCVLTLLRYGANANLKNVNGQTALHYAASWGLAEFCNILVEWHANVDAVDNEYLTPLNFCLIQVMQQKSHKPPSLMREIFQRNLPALKILIKSDCDTLGLATWFRQHTNLHAIEDKEFDEWQKRSQPESLKHLCRVYIQRRLCFTKVRHKYCTRKVKKLQVPESLKEYLCRRVLLEYS